MTTALFANNATSELAAAITDSDTSLTLVTGQGALFPNPTAGDWFLVTLTQASGAETSWEIVKCTARVDDTLTIVRAQESTTAAAWATAKAEQRLTAAGLGPVVAAGVSGMMTGADKTKLDAITGTNTGDNAVNTTYNGLVTNATHTGDVTGSAALTIANKVTMTGTAPMSLSGSPTVIAGSAVAISMAAASASAHGYMTSTYATKLDGIATAATAYSHPTNHAPSIITQDASNRFVTDTEKATWNAKQAAGTYATGTGTASGTNTGDQTLPTLASLGAVGVTDTQTLTNKTLTSPAINTPTIAGTREAKVAMGASNIDLATGNYFTKTLSGAATLTVSNVPAAGTAVCFILDVTNSGAYITWWANVKWDAGVAPTLTTTGRDLLGFFTHDGGTTWNGLVLGKAMA